MDGENNGKKNLLKWMIRGYHYFWKHPNNPKYQMKYQGAQSWCHCWFVRTILDRLEFCSMDGGRRLHRILSFGDLVPIITSHVLFLFLRAMNAPSLLLSTFCFLFGISSDVVVHEILSYDMKFFNGKLLR